MKAEGQVRALVAKGEWVPNKIKVSKRGLLKSKVAAIGGPEEVLLKAHVSRVDLPCVELRVNLPRAEGWYWHRRGHRLVRGDG